MYSKSMHKHRYSMVLRGAWEDKEVIVQVIRFQRGRD